MPGKSVELDGKRYVILPEEEYEALLRSRTPGLAGEDDPMTAEEEAALARLVDRAQGEPTVPYEQVRRELGLG